MLDQGDSAPNVTVQTSDGQDVKLLEKFGLPLVVYFYPKDDTPGCTREAQDFTALAAEFARAGITIVGVSKDSPKRHLGFTKKYGLNIALVTDTEGAVCEAFGTWVEKSLYGRKYMGIERATFLIGSDGRIAAIWRKVKVAGHAEAVLAAGATLA